jgi:hypothetical protein
LEGWDVRTSQVVEEWRNDARLETRREDFLALPEKRFGTLPEGLVQRIQTLADGVRLKAALRQVLDIHSLDELQL